MPASPQWLFDRFRLDPDHACLWCDAEAIVLPPKVFAVLHYLVTHPDRLVTKDELLDAVWPETAVSDAVVRIAVGKLRQVLGDTAQMPRYIATVLRRGYRFVATVTVIDPSETARAGEPLQRTAPPPPDVLVAQRGAETCLACGQVVPLPATFCPGCGQRLGALPVTMPLPHPGVALTSPQPAYSPAPTGERRRGPMQERAPLAYTPTPLAEKIRTSRAALQGERKQVTVLFADLKDSLELIRGLDPEAAQQLLDPALHAMMNAVHHYEGTVNQVLGDGIMALFGAPIAHEDHTVRACYAALAMQAALRDYAAAVHRTHGLTLQHRIGLNAGEVVVRAIRNDLHMDYSAVGQTTHLAARLEQLAPPDSILLTAATLQLVEGFVRVKAVGVMSVKGLTAPVEVYELLGASGMRRRLQAATARGLTRFVGRQTELTILHAALAQAGAGHGQVVAVVGEAGVGKSRLLYEFVQAVHAQGWLVLDSAAVSYGQATPYFSVLDLLRRYCHLEERDDTRTIQAKVTEQVRTLDATLQDTIPVLLALLDALPADSPFLQLGASQRRQLTLLALKRVLLRESQVQPLLLVFEDLHWLDTETQALLESLSESLPTARLLLLINYRPEYRHDWGSKTYYTQLRLDPLPPASADAFLQSLLGDDASLAPLTPLLIERTEGTPFFLEESVRTLVETGVLVGEPGAYRLAQALPAIQVPATVQAVLAARIDRLPLEEKHLLQTAAVMGTEVPLALLQAVVELPDDVLRLGLMHLQDAEFLYETSLFPELIYTFKHTLTQEVAYGSLLHERRRTLHARIVATLEALARDRVVEQVERLAYHALRGEVWEKALAYSRQAGVKALTRSTYQEAVIAFEQALIALQHLPESRATHAQAIDLRFDLRMAFMPLGAFQRALDILREAEALARTIDDQRRLGWTAGYLTNLLWEMGDQEQAMASGQRALEIAAQLADYALQGMAYRYLSRAYHAMGDYRRALNGLRQTASSEHSLIFVVVCLAELGEFTEGIACGEAGIQSAETGGRAWGGRAWNLSAMCAAVGRLYLHKGDLHQAIPLLERSLELCQDAYIPLMFPYSAAPLGAAYALSGRLAEARPLLEQAVEQAATMKRMVDYALWVAWLSEAVLLAGHLEEAHDFAQRALECSLTYKERGHQAWILWLLGDIQAQRQPADTGPAEASYQQALALANKLGMRPLQAHCHRGLGTLYAVAGQWEQARTELSTAIVLYRDMDMTFWLPQTEAALAQMAV